MIAICLLHMIRLSSTDLFLLAIGQHKSTKKRFLNKYEPINEVNTCSFLIITISFIAPIFICDFLNCPERRFKANFLITSRVREE